jgi:hypothetical protein
MIGFIGRFLLKFLSITINNNSSQSMSKTRSIRYWTTSVFSSTVTDLVLIYESVTSSASLVRWLILHSWTLTVWILLRLDEWFNEFTNELSFVTRGEPKRERYLELFVCYYLFHPLLRNVSLASCCLTMDYSASIRCAGTYLRNRCLGVVIFVTMYKISSYLAGNTSRLTKFKRLMLFRETADVYCKNRKTLEYTPGKNAELTYFKADDRYGTTRFWRVNIVMNSLRAAIVYYSNGFIFKQRFVLLQKYTPTLYYIKISISTLLSVVFIVYPNICTSLGK